ncbi:MAG: hypothetical protein PHH58_17530 [Rhodoferax sp.]|nr:hypothetical protein [Rhodoferax sp.]
MPNEEIARRRHPAQLAQLHSNGSALARPLAAGLLGALTMLLGACAAQQGVTVQRETAQIYPATTLVQVLQTLPPHPFERIAVLDVQAPTGTPVAQLLAQLQATAGALGANAIVVQNLSQSEGGTLQYNPAGGQFTTTPSQTVPHLRAIAIHLETPGKGEN